MSALDGQVRIVIHQITYRMAIPKAMRVLAGVSACLLFFLLFELYRSPRLLNGLEEKVPGMKSDPNLEGALSRSLVCHMLTEVATGEPEGVLWRADEYAADNPNAPRINATLLALVRNSELEGMLQSMSDLERTWNSKFNYPWTFFNDEPFTDVFKQRTQAQTKAKCFYGSKPHFYPTFPTNLFPELIPKDHWAVPPWINNDLFEESAQLLKEQNVQYGNLYSYHQMCRWNSGMFYKHPALLQTRYYWRVEPNVHFFCDVDYDVFRYMQDHNKTYGFTINLYDVPQSIPQLWPETEKFMAAHPEYLHENNAQDWLTDSQRRPGHNEKANGYSTCHFWSNFEIADMEFWRSQAYEDYFNHLDRAGGFFYERWGDAPVHSIALGLFEDSSKIHW